MKEVRTPGPPPRATHSLFLPAHNYTNYVGPGATEKTRGPVELIARMGGKSTEGRDVAPSRWG